MQAPAHFTLRNDRSYQADPGQFSHYDFLFKIVLIGDRTAGKTAVLRRYVNDEWDPMVSTTVGVDFKIRTIETEGKRIRLQVWDTAGAERFRSLTPMYYKGAMGIMLIYDLTDTSAFKDVRRWHSDIKRYAKEDVAILLVGNKSDQIDRRVVTEDQGHELAAELGIRYMETSAKMNMGIEEAFLTITKDIKFRMIDSQPENVTA